VKDLFRPDQRNCEPDGKGVHSEVESEGSCRQSAGSTNRKHCCRDKCRYRTRSQNATLLF